MYRVGDYVKHHRYGVCVVKEIIKRKNANKEVKKYYVLNTIYGVNTKITTPIDSPDLDDISSMEEVKELMEKLDDLPDLWIKENNIRQEKFKQILNTGSMLEIASLCHTLYKMKKQRNDANKSLPTYDARILSSAQKKLEDELIYILGADQEGAKDYIIKHLKQK